MSKPIPLAVLCLPLVAAALCATRANAVPVTITTPFMNLENRDINSLGFGSGTFLRFGANSVTPNGTAGTTGMGSTVSLANGQTVTRTIPFDPGPIIPNFYARYLADDPALYGAWTLRFMNGADTAQTVVSLPAGTTQAPFVNTITLSGTSANPTFTWTPPATSVVNGYRINIYDKALINNDPTKGPTSNGQVTSRNVTSAVTSYTVSASDFTVPGYAFTLGHNYSIEIGLIQTKDGTSNDLGNANLKAISRVYADFRPSQTGGPSVILPVTLDNGSFKYNFAVAPGTTYYIDPAVAIGYDYVTGLGDPKFRSVLLPTGIGDGLYDIFGGGAEGGFALLAHDWAAGTAFDFGAAGIDRFRVAGIEASAGLDPTDVTAFVTGLTFVSAGTFTGLQTPLVENVAAVPEPHTYALMLCGLGVVVVLGGRRRAGARCTRA